MKHRNIDFGVEELKPGEWQWTIYPKIEAGGKVHGDVTGSRDQAIAACTKEIDAGLDRR